jgi:hypothetical protein
MKQLVRKLINVTYQLSSVNRATLHADGEVSTSALCQYSKALDLNCPIRFVLAHFVGMH